MRIKISYPHRLILIDFTHFYAKKAWRFSPTKTGFLSKIPQKWGKISKKRHYVPFFTELQREENLRSSSNFIGGNLQKTALKPKLYF